MKNLFLSLLFIGQCQAALQEDPFYIIPKEKDPFEYICRITIEKDKVYVYVYGSGHTYEMIDQWIWVHADDRCLCFLDEDAGL